LLVFIFIPVMPTPLLVLHSFYFYSSRAHTIVGITFVQKYINPAGEETAKTSIVNTMVWA
jgi:hypothetical protein